MRLYRDRPDGGEQDRLAIGPGACGLRRADGAAGAGDIADHDRLAEGGRHLVLHQPGDDVGGAACGEVHDHLDLCDGRDGR